MKTIIKIRLVTALVAVAAFILILDGCKKADLKADASNVNIDIAAEKAKVANLIAKEGGIPQIFTRSQPATTFWADENRNAVSKEQMQNNNFTSVCNYDLPAFCNLVQYARVYRCASTVYGAAGYFLQFEFEMSWNNNVKHLDYGGTNRTTGFADIIDAGGTTLQSLSFDNTNSDVQIVEVGPDPNPSFPNNYIFRVKFVTTDFNTHWLPESYINTSGNSVNFSAMFVTDCKTGGPAYSLWTNPVTAYGFTGDSGNDPCKRNDKAWVTTPPSSGGTMFVSGYNPGAVTCGYGGSFVAPDLQEVQYKIDAGGWQNVVNGTAAGLGIVNSAFLRGGDFAQVTGFPSGTPHMVIVRYRNWKYGTTTPWNIPSIPNDCRSYANTSLPSSYQDYSTWAYQYWPY
jgi:hypothetical protein